MSNFMKIPLVGDDLSMSTYGPLDGQADMMKLIADFAILPKRLRGQHIYSHVNEIQNLR